MRDKAVRDVREEQQELEALHRLDEECVHQQRAGNYLKAFDCMERALVLRRYFFGIESEEVIQACRALAEMCNLLAMSFLQQDNYAVTIDLLKKAEVLTQRHHPAERATTMNNLACYYRRLGKLHSAMTSLKRALELEKRLENVRNAADTQLNMCAVLSQLGKHQEALEHAQEALITLQEGFIHGKQATDAAMDNVADPSSSRLDRISVMCIAYHNIGVEQEFLKDCAESVASYKKGISLAEQYLGADHSITTTIRNSYLAAKRTLATKTRVKSHSAGRNDKSPTKAGARLLLSPPSDSLRMPSPLAKEKDRHNIPTPRSIIADALSRAPLSALPPLEVLSPPSASKKKKTVVPNEVKSTAPPLSPTDPFFSPRFRFDNGATEPKTKKLASITSPQTATTANVEVRTPQSSNGKREKRKSSLRKSSLLAQTSGRVRKSLADAGASASRETVSPEPHTESAQKAVVAETIQAENENPDPAAQYRENNMVDRISDFNAQDMKLAIPQMRLDKRITGFVVEYVDGAISTVLAIVVGKIAEQGYDLHSHGVDTIPADESIIVTPMIRKQEAFDDPHDHVPEVNTVESTVLGESANTLNEDQADLPETIATTAEVVVGTGLTIDEVRTTSDFTDEIIGESSQQFTEDNVSEANAEVSQEFTDHSVNDLEVVNTNSVDYTSDVETAETSANDVQNDLEARNFSSLEPASNVENSGIHNIKEEPSEINPGEAIENHTVSESDGATTVVCEQYAMDMEAIDGIIPENDIQTNEDPEHAAPVEEEHISPLDSPEDDSTTLTGDVGEQVNDQEVEQQHFSNGEDEFAAASIENETQENYQGTERYEIGEYHDLSYASAEITTTVVEGQENSFEHVHQEVNNEDYLPSDQEFVVPALNYEQLNYEFAEVPLGGEAEQDWGGADQADPAAVENTTDYGDFYQDPTTPSHEEQFSYDENAVVSEYVGDQLPQEGEGFVPPIDTVPNDSTIDVDINVQDAAASE